MKVRSTCGAGDPWPGRAHMSWVHERYLEVVNEETTWLQEGSEQTGRCTGESSGQGQGEKGNSSTRSFRDKGQCEEGGRQGREEKEAKVILVLC